MNENYILAFDSIFSTNSMQLLKILMPLIPGKFQPLLAIFIKIEELQYAYQYLSAHPIAILNTDQDLSFEEKLSKTIKEIRPYCPAEYVKYIEQVESILNLLQKYKELSPVLELFKEGNDSNPLAMFLNNEQANSMNKYEKMLEDLF